ncbi:MAG: DNA polymerase III subunit delta [Syntrophomonadaceae bacterium]|nr:DNA polymerase III subunit delta [Syntrophomonadaceae bacterium]
MPLPAAYFLWGTEDYLIDKKIDEIITLVEQESGESPELLPVDADELTPLQLAENLEFSPLFSWRRIVLIKKPAFMKKTGRKQKQAKEYEQVLATFFAQNNSMQTIIITSAEYDKAHPGIKLLEKHADVIGCERPKLAEMRKWVANEFKTRNAQASNEAMGLIIQHSFDMYYMLNFIEKLVLITEGQSITDELVRQEIDVWETKNDKEIFAFIDGLMSRKVEEAVKSYYRLSNWGKTPYEVVGMINSRFVALARIKHYLDKGFKKEQIIIHTGMKDYSVTKMTPNSRKFSWDEINQIFDWLLEADYAIKRTGTDNELIMEMLIMRICTGK